MVGLIQVFLVATITVFSGSLMLFLLLGLDIPYLVSAPLSAIFGVIVMLRVMK